MHLLARRAGAELVALLVALAAAAWWWSEAQMRGMDNGPWTGLGSAGFFLPLWVVMTAAMMFPSVAPTVGLYAQMTRRRSVRAPLLFAAGYLGAWAAVGAAAFEVALLGHRVVGDALAWDRAGRWAAGVLILVAAAYQLTPLKEICLTKCRNPLGLLMGARRRGAAMTGATAGLWCIGCCWALMASLFALGIMSIVWMGVTAAVIAAEKLLPWQRPASYGAAGVLVVLALFILVAPTMLPGLTIPSMMPS